jgi:hypothetical protein
MLSKSNRVQPRWPIIAAAWTALAILPETQRQSEAALMLDGTTRAQMTAPNPAFDGFLASATTGDGNTMSPFPSSATHLWGLYYGIGTHQLLNGENIFYNLYSGSDYYNSPGPPIGILSIISYPFADFSIITAATADNSPRDPQSKLVGIALAQTGGTSNSGTTIYLHLADPDILNFINQVTGSSITSADVASGNSFIGDISPGQHVWGDTFGPYGTPGGGLFNPDGLSGQYQGVEDPNGARPGANQDPNYYFTTDFLNDGGVTNGPLNGKAINLDSGSPGIVIVPEPTGLGLMLASTAGLLLSQRRRGSQS